MDGVPGQSLGDHEPETADRLFAGDRVYGKVAPCSPSTRTEGPTEYFLSPQSSGRREAMTNASSLPLRLRGDGDPSHVEH